MIENENVWHALSELDTNALFLVDTKGIIRNINKGVTSLFGYSAHEIVGELLRLGADYAQGYHYSQPVHLKTLIAGTAEML